MEERDQKPLKVVDRRHFTPAGERREAQGPELPSELAPSIPEAAASPADERVPESPLFKELVMQLATSCMLNLGQIPHPMSKRPEVDLGAAGMGIDMLTMLKEKTQGNLAPEERDLLDDLLSQLRLAYFEATQRGAGR